MGNKILVVTGSPRVGGNSDTLADAFIKGAESAGNTVTRVDAGRMKIGGCLGCEYCFAHEGTCCRKDDMTPVYDMLMENTVLVYVSPIYNFEVTAQIKAFQDRMFCGIVKHFPIKQTAFITVFEDKDPTIVEPAVARYRKSSAYCGWEDLGVIAVNDTYKKGAIAGNPKLEEAYDLGASIV
jgi:multimeric flavodoxin WrbA